MRVTRVRVTRELAEQAKAKDQPRPASDPSLRAGPPREREQELVAQWKTSGAGATGAAGVR